MELSQILLISGVALAIILLGFLALFATCFKKVPQGKAFVRTGVGGLKVSFEKMWVFPVLHQLEIMDISLKSIEVVRTGVEGLVCKDNMRADIKVVFFVKVNKTQEDVKDVAQSIGCTIASDQSLLVSLFDAKFSEALKTAGKRFDFVQLYDSRDEFKKAILSIIGRDLNGYHLDDCAIDHLEQTPLSSLKEDFILDSEGIKKITELTAQQKILANQIRRDEEKTITKQNVEAQEAILELNRQLAEKEEKQKREIAVIKAREEAETKKITSEELLKSEKARIQTDEEIKIAEENKERQIIVSVKAKEKTEAVEEERVKKEQELEATEREKIVALAQIEKEKAVEVEKREIQTVIRERVMVEKSTVEEEEKIRDTKAFAEAERQKSVAITKAEELAEANLVQQLKDAEAKKQAAVHESEKKQIEAEAERMASEKMADAKKTLASAVIKEEAAKGMAEAEVMEAKSEASLKQGEVDANIIEKKAIAEAKGMEVKRGAENKADEEKGQIDAQILEQKGLAEAKVVEAKAVAINKQGLAEAEVMEKKALADALKIEAKAEAMKKLDGVGKDHEEFKLRLQQETEIALAKIDIQKEIANAQATVISEALKSSKINIVGGETMFYENILGAITKSKSLESLVDNSDTLTHLKDNLLNGNGSENGNGTSVITKVKSFVKQFGLESEDVKNLTIAALITKLMGSTDDENTKGVLGNLMKLAKEAGLDNQKAQNIL